MTTIDQLFSITFSIDKMGAHLHLKKEDSLPLFEKLRWREWDFIQYLKRNKVVFGHVPEAMEQLKNSPGAKDFPMLIAKGIPVKDGKAGYIRYTYNQSTEVNRSSGWNFHEVKRIPVVEIGEQIGKIIAPTTGYSGCTVENLKIKAKPGKEARKQLGKNVVFHDKHQALYAAAAGRVVTNPSLAIESVYEIKEDVSLKTGNIDFNGTVMIQGDVPTGFSIQASGDIFIDGIVEAAHIEAKGSVTIAKGIVGSKTGKIIAGENIMSGYVNQANLTAQGSVIIHQAILHSNIKAAEEVVSKSGDIIGGHITAGCNIIAHDIGNYLNTPTKLQIERNPSQSAALEEKKQQKSQLEKELQKIDILLKNRGQMGGTEARQINQKLQDTYQTKQQLQKAIQKEIDEINRKKHSLQDVFMEVQGTIFPKSNISFGKYHQTIMTPYHKVMLRIENKELRIVPYETE